MSLERYISDNAIRAGYFTSRDSCNADSVFKFFGLSDKAIVDFVLAAGKQTDFLCATASLTDYISASSSKSPEGLFSSLKGAGLPDTPDAHAFIQEVYTRAPRKSKSAKDSARKQSEKDLKNADEVLRKYKRRHNL